MKALKNAAAEKIRGDLRVSLKFFLLISLNGVADLFSSRSMAVSECTPEEEKQLQDEAGLQAPSPLVHGHISSDDSEAEGPEELSDFPSSAAHPRPVAVKPLYPYYLQEGDAGILFFVTE